MPDRILRVPDVTETINVSRSTLYEMMARNEFPRPIKLSARIVGWRESVIDQWIKVREHDTVV